ncbi:MAG: ribonuclease Z [Verrucomicrobiales bacterium]
MNGRGNLPRILYPADCGSFDALAEFSRAFDPHQEGAPEWVPVRVGDRVPIGKGRFLSVLPNEHSEAACRQTKSVSYRVEEERRRLRPEHAALIGPEIGALKKAQGEDAVTTVACRPLLGYSGDATFSNGELWESVPVLIHEATFLGDVKTEGLAQKHRHCVLSDVVAMAARLPVETLILGHFSTRYSHEQIIEAVGEECERSQFQGRVAHVLPGENRVIECP